MEHKVFRYLRETELVCGGERVTVAVSGGADSMALLEVLLRLRECLHITVSAAHFNHGLRGEEAARDEAFVRSRCAQYGISLTVERADAGAYAAQTGKSIEEAARDLRYAFFERLDTDLVATAHTADDNAETLLLHLLRGTGPRGLCGIPARRGRFIRPLLQMTHNEILSFLDANGLPHVEDSTNAEDGCVRNRIRHAVMPLLLRENPRFSETVSRTAALQTQEDAYLSALAAAAAEDCRTENGFDCKKLRALHPVLLRRVLLSALCASGVENPSADFVAALLHLTETEDPSAVVQLSGGLRAVREYDRLVFTHTVPESFAPCLLSVPGTAEIPELGLTVSCFVTENSKNFTKKTDTLCLKYDMIAENVLLRPRKAGDCIRLPGGTRTLKKLMIDRKIPARERDALPVIELGGHIAAVWQLATDTAFVPQSGEKALVIKLQRKDCK